MGQCHLAGLPGAGLLGGTLTAKLQTKKGGQTCGGERRPQVQGHAPQRASMHGERRSAKERVGLRVPRSTGTRCNKDMNRVDSTKKVMHLDLALFYFVLVLY